MTTLHNYRLKQYEELSPDEESRFGTDPDFVSSYVPQDHKTQERYRKLVGAGMAPHAAAMLATSSHTGKVEPSRLIETTNTVADIARRHTRPGPNGGSWDTPHTPGTSTQRTVVVHRHEPSTTPTPPVLTPPKAAPKPRPKKSTKPPDRRQVDPYRETGSKASKDHSEGEQG